MAIAMPAYQQESASQIAPGIFDAWYRSRLCGFGASFICDGYAEIRKPMVSKGIIYMDERLSFSASPNVYEDGWVSAKPQRESSEFVKASEFNPVQSVNKNGRIVLADKTNRLLCFEYMQNGNLREYFSGEHHGLDWHLRYKIIQEICKGLAYLHQKLEAPICHLDLKPANVLLDENLVPKITDFGLSRCLGEEQTRITRSSIGTQGYLAPEYIERKVISNKYDIYSLGVIIIEMIRVDVSKATTAEEILQAYWRNRPQPLASLSKLMKTILKKIIFICLETGKSTKVTRSTVSSMQRAVYDILVLDSAAGIRVTVDVAEMKPLRACITAPNMDKAPTAEDSVDLVLDSDGSALTPAPCMHQHLLQSNLTDERSDKPRSNRAPANSSSDETTRAPKAHKLTDDEAENHSDPNSLIAERDTIEDAKRSGKWYVATGAAHHATGDRRLITNLLEFEHNGLCVHAADGTPMPVRGCGSVVTDNVVLPDVYYVPGLWTNLVSVGQLAGLDYCVGFGRGACVVSDAAGTVVGRAHARGDGLYEVDYLRVPLDIPWTGS